MGLIVQKFGGSSVANTERVMNVAKIVTDTYKKGNDVVVVVSAQGDTTDDLIAKAREISAHNSKREMDMLMAAGEQISIALLAMAIEELGCPDSAQIPFTLLQESKRLKQTESEPSLTTARSLLLQASRDLTSIRT